MRFLAVVPARRGSTRLADKPLLDIAGKPMVVRVAELARESGAYRVLVATDDAAIIGACREFDVEAVLTSPSHASGTDRIAEVITTLQLAADEIVVNVQGDEPLIEPALIRKVAGILVDAPDCAMATASHAISDPADLFNPNVVKVVCDSARRALYFSRAPIPWDRDAFANGERPTVIASERHIGLYAYRASFLRTFPTLAATPLEDMEKLEQLRALHHGFRIAVYESASAPAAGVDTAADLERVRAVFAAAR